MMVKTLIFKLSVFTFIVFGSFTFILMNYGGYVDYFYEKFTSPKSKSIIIGDSRALNGIKPEVINTNLNSIPFDLPILNYSFTIAQSRIGPLYNSSILKKIDKSSKNGLFLISITPLMLSSDISLNNVKGEFTEKGMPPHNMTIVDFNPNYEYLIKNLNYFHFKAIFRKKALLHKDGWFEEKNIPTTIKGIYKSNKIAEKIFASTSKNYKPSKFRLKSLDTLITNLKEYGNVYLVRTPISNNFYKLEEKFYPSFEFDIDSIANKNHIEYLNFHDLKIDLYDGEHLSKNEAEIFTEALCDSISSFF
ncbi:MAG: hypothetical protein ABJK28_10155 [Algibacter sp.]